MEWWEINSATLLDNPRGMRQRFQDMVTSINEWNSEAENGHFVHTSFFLTDGRGDYGKKWYGYIDAEASAVEEKRIQEEMRQEEARIKEEENKKLMDELAQKKALEAEKVKASSLSPTSRLNVRISKGASQGTINLRSPTSVPSPTRIRDTPMKSPGSPQQRIAAAKSPKVSGLDDFQKKNSHPSSRPASSEKDKVSGTREVIPFDSSSSVKSLYTAVRRATVSMGSGGNLFSESSEYSDDDCDDESSEDGMDGGVDGTEKPQSKKGKVKKPQVRARRLSLTPIERELQHRQAADLKEKRAMRKKREEEYARQLELQKKGKTLKLQKALAKNRLKKVPIRTNKCPLLDDEGDDDDVMIRGISIAPKKVRRMRRKLASKGEVIDVDYVLSNRHRLMYQERELAIDEDVKEKVINPIAQARVERRIKKHNKGELKRAWRRAISLDEEERDVLGSNGQILNYAKNLWMLCSKTLPSKMQMEEYLAFYAHISNILFIPTFTKDHKKHLLDREWIMERKLKYVNESMFVQSLIQLAHIWAPSRLERDYVNFFQDIFSQYSNIPQNMRMTQVIVSFGHTISPRRRIRPKTADTTMSYRQLVTNAIEERKRESDSYLLGLTPRAYLPLPSLTDSPGPQRYVCEMNPNLASSPAFTFPKEIRDYEKRGIKSRATFMIENMLPLEKQLEVTNELDLIGAHTNIHNDLFNHVQSYVYHKKTARKKKKIKKRGGKFNPLHYVDDDDSEVEQDGVDMLPRWQQDPFYVASLAHDKLHLHTNQRVEPPEVVMSEESRENELMKKLERERDLYKFKDHKPKHGKISLKEHQKGPEGERSKKFETRLPNQTSTIHLSYDAETISTPLESATKEHFKPIRIPTDQNASRFDECDVSWISKKIPQHFISPSEADELYNRLYAGENTSVPIDALLHAREKLEEKRIIVSQSQGDSYALKAADTYIHFADKLKKVESSFPEDYFLVHGKLEKIIVERSQQI